MIERQTEKRRVKKKTTYDIFEVSPRFGPTNRTRIKNVSDRGPFHKNEFNLPDNFLKRKR